MQHIIIVKVESDRSGEELANEIQSNLEYEGIDAETVVASEAVTQALRHVEG